MADSCGIPHHLLGCKCLGVETESGTALRRILGDALSAEPGMLPCPFCGCTWMEVTNLVDPDDYYVRCTKCEVQQIANYTRDEAIRRWNTRISVLTDAVKPGTNAADQTQKNREVKAK